jgi:hypothetical protein
MRIWLMLDSEAYKLRLTHIGPDGCAWTFTKWSDGTSYTLHESDGDSYTCTCPGFQGHGPRCNGGKGCKHRRVLLAVRQVVDPGL